jgi:hypothetical protein
MELKMFLLCSQESPSCLFPEPDESCFFKIQINVILKSSK